MFRLKLLKISRQLLFHLLAQLTLSLGEWKELRFEIRIITTKVLSSSSNFVNSNVSKLPVKKVTQILYIYGTMAEETMSKPKICNYPLFLAGRKLIERGLADEAVDIYATLLEETRLQYGDISVEAAPAYYEYGNTLLRAVTKRQMAAVASEEAETKAEQRTTAAAAAEKRLQNSSDSVSNDTKEDSKEDDRGKPKNDGESGKDNTQDEGNDNNDAGEDVGLALEMMENSFSILEEYKVSIGKEGDSKYSEWVKEQLPRVLMGIGDTLSKLDRHADAADAYSRALELRKACLQEFSDNEKNQFTAKHLKAHRTVCEANILIAEELLTCPPDINVVTTETQSLIVKSEERVSYARGYYDQARDALQEAVVFMGSMPTGIDLGREKEDVCFLATLVMGVGETLAAIDEKAEESAVVKSTEEEPMKKKLKKG